MPWRSLILFLLLTSLEQLGLSLLSTNQLRGGILSSSASDLERRLVDKQAMKGQLLDVVSKKLQDLNRAETRNLKKKNLDKKKSATANKSNNKSRLGNDVANSKMGEGMDRSAGGKGHQVSKDVWSVTSSGKGTAQLTKSSQGSRKGNGGSGRGSGALSKRKGSASGGSTASKFLFGSKAKESSSEGAEKTIPSSSQPRITLSPQVSEALQQLGTETSGSGSGSPSADIRAHNHQTRGGYFHLHVLRRAAYLASDLIDIRCPSRLPDFTKDKLAGLFFSSGGSVHHLAHAVARLTSSEDEDDEAVVPLRSQAGGRTVLQDSWTSDSVDSPSTEGPPSTEDPSSLEEDPSSLEDPPSTEEDPPSKEENPPSTEEDPPSTEEDPPSIEEDPPSTGEDPPSTEEVPPSIEEDPPSTEEDSPSTEGDPLSTEEDSPATEGDPPSTEEDPPSTEEDPPSTEEDPPSTEEDPPSTEEDPPSTEEDSPSTEEDPPSTEEDPPSTGEDPPSTEEDPPSTEEDPPPTEEDPPSTEEDPPSTEEDPSSKEEDPRSTEGDSPSTEGDPPSMEGDPPSTEEDPPSAEENPPSADEDPESTEEIAIDSERDEADNLVSPESINPESVEEMVINPGREMDELGVPEGVETGDDNDGKEQPDTIQSDGNGESGNSNNSEEVEQQENHEVTVTVAGSHTNPSSEYNEELKNEGFEMEEAKKIETTDPLGEEDTPASKRGIDDSSPVQEIGSSEPSPKNAEAESQVGSPKQSEEDTSAEASSSAREEKETSSEDGLDVERAQEVIGGTLVLGSDGESPSAEGSGSGEGEVTVDKSRHGEENGESVIVEDVNAKEESASTEEANEVEEGAEESESQVRPEELEAEEGNGASHIEEASEVGAEQEALQKDVVQEVKLVSYEQYRQEVHKTAMEWTDTYCAGAEDDKGRSKLGFLIL